MLHSAIPRTQIWKNLLKGMRKMHIDITKLKVGDKVRLTGMIVEKGGGYVDIRFLMGCGEVAMGQTDLDICNAELVEEE